MSGPRTVEPAGCPIRVPHWKGGRQTTRRLRRPRGLRRPADGASHGDWARMPEPLEAMALERDRSVALGADGQVRGGQGVFGRLSVDSVQIDAGETQDRLVRLKQTVVKRTQVEEHDLAASVRIAAEVVL